MTATLDHLKDEILEIEKIFIKEDVYEVAKPSLYNLPVELFLKICTFLEVDFIQTTLSKVCTRFQDILNDTIIWKLYVKARVQNCFPPVPNLEIWSESEIDWEEASKEICRERRVWNSIETSMKHMVVKDVHFASVDTVLLINDGQLCVSGGRDRGMALWKVLDIKPNDFSENITSMSNSKPECMRINAHNGWVWDLTADDIDRATTIFSVSWDNSLKSWDLESGFVNTHTYPCGMSALSVAYANNLVFAGLYSKKILVFDIRVGTSCIKAYKPHKGPVLELETYNNKIASVSEDRSLAVFDLAAGKVITNNVKLPTEAYPVCISWSQAAIYVGDSRGFLHCVDPERLVYVKSHELWQLTEKQYSQCKVTGCHQGLATMVACCDGGEIKFFYNSFPPVEFATLKSNTADVTQLRYQNGILAVGTCDSALEVWIPNEMIDRHHCTI